MLFEYVGLQRKALIYIYKINMEYNEPDGFPIKASDLSSALNASKATTKNTIQRLKNKGALATFCCKTGRGGWTRYKLSDEVFAALHTTRNFKLLEAV